VQLHGAAVLSGTAGGGGASCADCQIGWERRAPQMTESDARPRPSAGGECGGECQDEWDAQRYGDDSAATMCAEGYHIDCLACEFCPGGDGGDGGGGGETAEECEIAEIVAACGEEGSSGHLANCQSPCVALLTAGYYQYCLAIPALKEMLEPYGVSLFAVCVSVCCCCCVCVCCVMRLCCVLLCLCLCVCLCVCVYFIGRLVDICAPVIGDAAAVLDTCPPSCDKCDDDPAGIIAAQGYDCVMLVASVAPYGGCAFPLTDGSSGQTVAIGAVLCPPAPPPPRPPSPAPPLEPHRAGHGADASAPHPHTGTQPWRRTRRGRQAWLARSARTPATPAHSRRRRWRPRRQRRRTHRRCRQHRRGRWLGRRARRR
jgi:hypothetical protein